MIVNLKKKEENNRFSWNEFYVGVEIGGIAEEPPSLMLQSKRRRTKTCLHSTRSGYWSLLSILCFCVL